MQEWEKIEEKLAAMPSMNPAKKKFLDVTNYYGQMAEMDAQGRVADSAVAAGDGKDGRAMWLCSASRRYLEVANHDSFKRQARCRADDRGRRGSAGSAGVVTKV